MMVTTTNKVITTNKFVIEYRIGQGDWAPLDYDRIIMAIVKQEDDQFFYVQISGSDKGTSYRIEKEQVLIEKQKYENYFEDIAAAREWWMLPEEE